MQEIELKILEIDKERTIRRLLKIGAKCVGEFHIHDKQFDFLNGQIAAADELLRLRSIGDRTILTYKDQKQNEDGFRIAEETEIVVEDFAKIEYILHKLGLTSHSEREKIRTSFVKEKVKFEIDEYPMIPPYLELEGTKEDIVQALNMLGYSMDDTTDMTAAQVLRQYSVNAQY